VQCPFPHGFCSSSGLGSVRYFINSFLVRAVGAAVKYSVGFDAMADHLAAAVRALWRQQVDRAFKAIEGVRFSRHDDFERFIVFIAAGFTGSHGSSFRNSTKDCISE
jgi:hypothetical protein